MSFEINSAVEGQTDAVVLLSILKTIGLQSGLERGKNGKPDLLRQLPNGEIN